MWLKRCLFSENDSNTGNFRLRFNGLAIHRPLAGQRRTQLAHVRSSSMSNQIRGRRLRPATCICSGQTAPFLIRWGDVAFTPNSDDESRHGRLRFVTLSASFDHLRYLCCAEIRAPWREVGTHCSVRRLRRFDDDEWSPIFGVRPIGALRVVDHRQHRLLQCLSVGSQP